MTSIYLFEVKAKTIAQRPKIEDDNKESTVKTEKQKPQN